MFACETHYWFMRKKCLAELYFSVICGWWIWFNRSAVSENVCDPGVVLFSVCVVFIIINKYNRAKGLWHANVQKLQWTIYSSVKNIKLFCVCPLIQIDIILLVFKILDFVKMQTLRKKTSPCKCKYTEIKYSSKFYKGKKKLLSNKINFIYMLRHHHIIWINHFPI